MLIAWSVALVIAGAHEVPVLREPLLRLELMAYDLRFRVRGPRPIPRSPITICSIGDAAITALGQFPIPRQQYIRALEHLHDVDVVGLDLLFLERQFSSGTPEEVDALLAAYPHLTPEQRKARFRDLVQHQHDDALAAAIRDHGRTYVPLVLTRLYPNRAAFVTRALALSKRIKAYLEMIKMSPWEIRSALDRNEMVDRIVRATDMDAGAVSDGLTYYLAEWEHQQNQTLESVFGREPSLASGFRDLESFSSEDRRAYLDRLGSATGLAEAVLLSLWYRHELAWKTSALMDRAELDDRPVSDVFAELLASADDADTLETRQLQMHLRLASARRTGWSSVKGDDRLLYAQQYAVPLLPLCEAVPALSHVNTSEDDDGVIRRIPLVVRTQWQGETHLVPALALLLAADFLGVAPGHIQVIPGRHVKLQGARFPGDGTSRTVDIPIDEEGTMAINWVGRWGTAFRHESMHDLIATPVPSTSSTERKTLSRIVLLGLTATGTHDFNPVPMQPRYPMVGMQANAVSTILDEAFLVPAPVLWNVGLIAMSAMSVALFAGRYGYMGVMLSLPGACLLSIVASYLAFVHAGRLVVAVLPCISAAGTSTLVTLYQYVTVDRRRAKLRARFETYMHPQVVRDIVENPADLELGGRERDVTVFFSDIAGFTTISERLCAHELVSMLNDYLSEMTEGIIAHFGTLDKFEGDAIMAFWGAPHGIPDHARRACLAALENLSRLEGFRRRLSERGLPDIDIRIGINSGPAIVGNIGSRQHMDYTAIGDTVNLASRLEGVNKVFGTRIIIGDVTATQVNTHFVLRELDLLQVKGKLQPVHVFELVGMIDGVDDLRQHQLERFDRGLGLYRRRAWREAHAEFKAALDLLPDDEPSRVYMGRCEEFQTTPPPKDWSGVFVMTTK